MDDNIPLEIIAKIAEFTDCPTFCNLRLTCYAYSQVLDVKIRNKVIKNNTTITKDIYGTITTSYHNVKSQIDIFGNFSSYLNGNLHNIDGPALIIAGQLKVWYRFGKIHRIGEPAYIQYHGIRLFFENGRLLRGYHLNGKEIKNDN